MRKQSNNSKDSASSNQGGNSHSKTTAKETDPLLQGSAPSYSNSGRASAESGRGGSIRSRRSSRSPAVPRNQEFGASSNPQGDPMSAADTSGQNFQQYDILEGNASRSGNFSIGDNSRHSANSGPQTSFRRQYAGEKESVGSGGNEHPPLLEIPEEIYGVRKAALQVLKPLTKTWLVVSIGFALTVLFGMARWTGLLHELPFWFILLPSWLSHVGLFWCHIRSAKALSTFIAEANDSRQRPDSRDHLDRTEYLPLLQRTLKFGLKTGLISFGVFIFEILVYVRLSKGTMSLSVVFLPIWVMVVGGILDGIICKTQHPVRVVCWILTFVAMLLACLKVDFGVDSIRWRMVVAPIVSVLSIASGSLIYIVYGHQVGYYRLTESQLTAGNLYSLAALISIVLTIVIGEVIPLVRPVEIETRVFVVLMAPLVVTLVGMGAWVVSRDEFGRLLLYGGQAAVHPRKLRWQVNGWTTVQGKGVVNIPMFGEVSFQPLEQKPEANIELCMCCTCYPYEEDEEETAEYIDELNHPYLAPAPSNAAGSKPYSQWQQEATQSASNV